MEKRIVYFSLLLLLLIAIAAGLMKWGSILKKDRSVSDHSKSISAAPEKPVVPEDLMMKDYADIHKGLTVCDTHCDTVDRVLNQGIDLGVRSGQGHVDIPRLKEGGVDVQVFACCISRSGRTSEYHVKLALKKINALRLQFEKHPDDIALALKAGDIQRAEQDGKIAAIIGVEGGRAIGDDLNVLRNFYRLGARIMTLTWNSNNWADASQESPKHNGLTSFGKDVVREMNRLGMIVDVSHASDKTVWDALEISSAPIIASHSCAKSLCDHPRNLNDELIKAIASTGGVICVNFYSLFVDQEYKTRIGEIDRLRVQIKKKFSNDKRRLAEETEKLKKLMPAPPPFSKVLDHIDHIVKVGGIDCVGLGSDFDGMNPPPSGLEDVSKMPRITEALLKRGYSARDVKNIMGGNFLRVFNHVCNENSYAAAADR